MSKVSYIRTNNENFSLRSYYETFGLDDRPTAEDEFRLCIDMIANGNRRKGKKWATFVQNSDYSILFSYTAEAYWTELETKSAALRLHASLVRTVSDLSSLSSESDAPKKRGRSPQIDGPNTNPKRRTILTETLEQNAPLDVWKEWVKYIDEGKTCNAFYEHSPEQFGVIWCGKGIKRRASMPFSVFHSLDDVYTVGSDVPLPTQLVEQILKAPTLERMLALCGQWSSKLKETKEWPTLAIGMILAEQIYSNFVDIGHSEIMYNYALLWPCLEVCARYMRQKQNTMVVFYPGEETLESMQRQLHTEKCHDDRVKYLADGVVRFRDMANLEVLLLETSQAYDMTTDVKKSFDQHKATFGLLAMLRAIAERFPNATPGTFSQLKLHFIHAAGKEIRHWSISCAAKGAFPMIREDKVTIPVEFSRKEQEFVPFVEFWLCLIAALCDTHDVLKKIKKEHQRGKNKASLTDIVNPEIHKITEQKHSVGLGTKGPVSTDTSPASSQDAQ